MHKALIKICTNSNLKEDHRFYFNRIISSTFYYIETQKIYIGNILGRNFKGDIIKPEN